MKKRKSVIYVAFLILLTVSLIILPSCKVKEKTTPLDQEPVDEPQNPVEDHEKPLEKAETLPCLYVCNTSGKPGETVEVFVMICNNPGIFGMDFDLYYDDQALTLVDAASAVSVDGCFFTAPAYYRNPTTFLWDCQDQCLAADGELLKLIFSIASNAPEGEYEVQIKYSYGNIFDSDGCPVSMKTENGIIRLSSD